MNINVDNEFKNSNLKKSVYKDIIKLADGFLEEYNKKLKSQIHKNFWKDFYCYEGNNFEVKIITSNVGNYQLYMEQTDSEKTSWNIYHSPRISTQARLLELKNQGNLTIIEDDDKVFLNVKNTNMATICNLTFNDYTTIFKVDSTSLVFTHNLWVGLTSKNERLETVLEGPNLIFGNKNPLKLKKMFDSSVTDYLNFEIREKYFESNAFKKSLVHPKLKKLAENIKQKVDKANSNPDYEYPLWEFQQDVQNMNEVAKKNGLDDSYVDQMLQSNQYNPVSGNLLWYYSKPSGYMHQWIFLNIGLLVLFFIWKVFHQEENEWLNGIALACLVTINGYVFSKKPDLIGIQYWIIPGLLFIANFFLIYFNKFLQILKP